MKKNILIFSPFYHHWTLETMTLQIIRDNLKLGHNIFLIDCMKDFKFCITNPFILDKQCFKCHKDRENFDLITKKLTSYYDENYGEIHRIPLNNLSSNDLSEIRSFISKKYDSRSELEKVYYEDFPLGLAVSCDVIYHIRDPNPNLKKLRYMLQLISYDALLSYKCIQKIIDTLNISEGYIFNGRFASTRGALYAFKKKNISFYCFDDVSQATRAYGLAPNASIQSLSYAKDRLNHAKELINESTTQEAIHWYTKRSNRGTEFTSSHQLGFIPKAWSESKKIKVSIFISSEDEIETFPEYRMLNYKNQTEFIEKLFSTSDIFDHFTFCLRVHPNLKLLDNSQIKALKIIAKKHPQIILIDAKDPTDTYELVRTSDLVTTYTSTVGIEAAFLTKKVIVFGVALYEDLPGIIKVDSVAKFIEEIQKSEIFDKVALYNSAIQYGIFVIKSKNYPLKNYIHEAPNTGKYYLGNEIIQVTPKIYISSIKNILFKTSSIIKIMFNFRIYYEIYLKIKIKKVLINSNKNKKG